MEYLEMQISQAIQSPEPDRGRELEMRKMRELVRKVRREKFASRQVTTPKYLSELKLGLVFPKTETSGLQYCDNRAES